MLGRLRDVVADHGEPVPLVTALEVRRRSHSRLVLWESLAVFEPQMVQLRDGAEAPERELTDTELLLRRDVLDCQIVDLAGRRLLRVGDVEMRASEGRLSVVAVEVGTAAVLRRLGLLRFGPE